MLSSFSSSSTLLSLVLFFFSIYDLLTYALLVPVLLPLELSLSPLVFDLGVNPIVVILWNPPTLILSSNDKSIWNPPWGVPGPPTPFELYFIPSGFIEGVIVVCLNNFLGEFVKSTKESFLVYFYLSFSIWLYTNSSRDV